MQNPEWLEKAKSYLGEREIPGKKHNSKILGWWKKIKSSFYDDETPWCAAFVGGVLEECGLSSTNSAKARSYEKWGIELLTPAVGCVVVFWRNAPESWSGHVGFVVGEDALGRLMVLGGNQNNEVSIQPFSRSRVLSYRWPADDINWHPEVGYQPLPKINLNLETSTDER